MRARYHDEETDEYTSGPWTDEATLRVQNNPPTAPTELEATETESNWVRRPSSCHGPPPARATRPATGSTGGATADSLTELVQDTGDTETSYTDAARRRRTTPTSTP